MLCTPVGMKKSNSHFLEETAPFMPPRKVRVERFCKTEAFWRQSFIYFTCQLLARFENVHTGWAQLGVDENMPNHVLLLVLASFKALTS